MLVCCVAFAIVLLSPIPGHSLKLRPAALMPTELLDSTYVCFVLLTTLEHHFGQKPLLSDVKLDVSSNKICVIENNNTALTRARGTLEAELLPCPAHTDEGQRPSHSALQTASPL